MPEVPFFICGFHAAIAWARAMKEKIPDEAARSRDKSGLDRHRRLNVAKPGDYTMDQLRALANQALQQFYDQIADQVAFVEYFKREWGKKIGELVFQLRSGLQRAA